MKARKLIPWVMWSSLVGFGILLPFAIGQDPRYALPVSVLRALGCMGFIAGVIVLFRSSGASAPGAKDADEMAIVPRTLCNNPLAAAHGTLPLSERIDMAAEASNAYGRSFGVIYYSLDSYDRISASHGETAADAAADFILGMLPTVLRGTDRAESVGAGRFVVCVTLLPDQDTLRLVRERVAKAMSNMRMEALDNGPIEYDSGAAIHPLHAKSGAELLAHAKRDCEAARERRQPRPAPYALATVGPSSQSRAA